MLISLPLHEAKDQKATGEERDHREDNESHATLSNTSIMAFQI
jgi:hypothetical protein